MAKTLDWLYERGEQIYSTQPYKWDGKSRPVLTDYTAPWAEYSNYEEANSMYKKARHFNDATRYAKTQLEIAYAQYQDDLAFWNEHDERDYTDQSSQAQRFEDAGFNMGYIYGSIDSGNSAVGYNQGNVSLNPNDTSNRSVEQLKQVNEVVSGVFSLATQLVKSGFDIRLIDKKTAVAQWQKVLTFQQGHALSLQNKWTEILRSYSPDGEDVGDNFEQSIAFLSEKLNYQLRVKEYSRLQTFVKYCDDLYRHQSTDMVKEVFGDLNNIIDSVEGDGIQALLRLLAVMAVSKSQK